MTSSEAAEALTASAPPRARSLPSPQLHTFSGASRRFYSVAEHSVWVSHLVEGRDLQRAALLHDASEAYVVDLPRPLKHLPELAGYRELERRVEEAIARRWHLHCPLPVEVKQADVMMLAAECRQLMRVEDAVEWWGELATRPLPAVLDGVKLGLSAPMAEALFLSRAAALGIR